MVRANGIALHVAELGTGPMVLMLHGFPQFWWTWQQQLVDLADAGFRDVAVDLHGYGASDAGLSGPGRPICSRAAHPPGGPLRAGVLPLAGPLAVSSGWPALCTGVAGESRGGAGAATARRARRVRTAPYGAGLGTLRHG